MTDNNSELAKLESPDPAKLESPDPAELESPDPAELESPDPAELEALARFKSELEAVAREVVQQFGCG
jgi:hypothetical protein